MNKVTRRSFVAGIGAASMLPAAALSEEAAATSSSPMPPGSQTTAPAVYLFFNASEAACERLIPADEHGAGALATGVPNYLDEQLGGAGERLYRSGPWAAGSSSQGYQLPFTPGELFHQALRAINHDLDSRDTPFPEMTAEAQDEYLKFLEGSGADLNGVPSGVFFAMLLQMTIEGIFSDPVYGGNRDMVAWRMIGFPGAYADYYDWIDRPGVKFVREPMSLGEDALALAVAALVALATGGIARSETTSPPSATVCERCHGVHGEGNAPAGIPRLAGQSMEYLGKQLEDYAGGDRANPIMQNFAKPLSHADIVAISSYFSAASAPNTTISSTASAFQLDLGRQLAQLAREGSEVKRVQACNSCHGPDGVGVLHAAPDLAGQSAQYLTNAITSFQQRTRKNDPGKLMSSVAGQLSTSDIAAAAAYFSSLPSGIP